jgi:hypothetical protein
MAHGGNFYIGEAVRARIRVMTVDPITEQETPDPAVSSVTIRFKNPDGTVLEENTLGAGVINAGNGYYHATGVPTTEGLNWVQFETGGANPGRSQVNFGVDPF